MPSDQDVQNANSRAFSPANLRERPSALSFASLDQKLARESDSQIDSNDDESFEKKPSRCDEDAKDSSDLASFVSRVTGENPARVEESLGKGYVRLEVAEAERRQAAHDIRWVEDALLELLRNARDAGARSLYVATSRSGSLRVLTVIDDGKGIPKEFHERIFEPRVTSKLDTMVSDEWGVHGRGMALYSIAQNALEAKVAFSSEGYGTAITCTFDTEKLKERADQSSLPILEGDDLAPSLKGPRNLYRVSCEFCLKTSRPLDVYEGSPAEILATLRANAQARVTEERLIFARPEELTIAERLLAASSGLSLIHEAQRLGLSISERTAHRILAGEVRPLAPLKTRLLKGTVYRKVRKQRHSSADLERDRRGLKVDSNDLKAFQKRLTRAFSFLGSRYFLELIEAPQVRVLPGKISVSFHVREDET